MTCFRKVNKARKSIALFLATVLLLVIAVPVLAQEDSLIACIEEVKQIREKEGPEWFEKNKTSCLGERVIGKWSVLQLKDFDETEVYNDMELEFFAFFDTPVAGVEVREGQMEYQETSKPNDPGRGFKVEKKVGRPGIGDKSLHQIETTYTNIAEGFSKFSPTWAGYTIYQELMVIVGNCSFMVGGRAVMGANWSFNHRVDWKNDVVINSDHDHGEEKLKQGMQEYARGLVNRVSDVCNSLGGATETKKGSVVDWAKGLLARPEMPTPESEEAQAPADRYWESVRFMTEEEKQKSREVNRWIEENLGEFETKKIEKESLEYESYARTPQMTDQIVRQAQAAWKKTTEDVRFFDEKSFPQEWRTVVEDQLKPGAEIISGDDFTAIFKADGGSVLYYPSSFGVYIVENIYNLEGGLVEVKTGTVPIDIKTINAFIKSKGTHYWVSYDAVKRVTAVGVYEGEVEVTVRDGKMIRVRPEGDKPGVVVISQKLSLVKLAALSLGLVGIVGATLFVLRKWFVSKRPRKK